MAAISPNTRAAIKAYLEVFIENLVSHYRGRSIPAFTTPSSYLAQKSTRPRLKPFHAAIIPSELLRISEFERGFSTTLGTTFEECARRIALEHHAEAHRGYEVAGKVSLAAMSEIERQAVVFEHAADSKGHKPTLEQMIGEVLDAQKDDELALRTARADLYILARDGTEFFFELKSPVPNKGQCLEITQRILRFHLLRGQPRPKVQAYFAMAYNPYGPSREDYRWSIALNYAPFSQAVVIGHEFWSIVGGPTAYEELLEIYHEVGREKGKYMIDALAFGF
ncbi:MAG: TdeIII family type II restriction endonuclease [Anaerolineae bacterium]|nr:TdeIII family type II restriction endonuclease [Anaerolineae bacterium]